MKVQQKRVMKLLMEMAQGVGFLSMNGGGNERVAESKDTANSGRGGEGAKRGQITDSEDVKVEIGEDDDFMFNES